MKKLRAVYIEWIDSYSTDGWNNISTAINNTSEIMVCRTIGFVVARTKKHITISHSFAWDDIIAGKTVCGIIHIPMKCIKLIKEIKI